MKLGRKRVATNDNARDLIACGQSPAGKAVDPNGGSRPRNLFEHALQLLRIVGELIDLGL